ncbi:adenosine deaminase [Streptomyces marianii]|uniref:Adenosine deaminase n=1 Tax=Streptomyces marianii TaxID=1817406 RepID=A0A5R9DYP2_9ACTN|nr:adenosine deaminase [Streptomyces marianii]TLQ42791.1 adenosine deaminase [Streptomyces marianii]
MHLSDNSAAESPAAPAPVAGWIRRAPKAVLHDHLDGGLRPATIIELAGECGYGDLPTDDPDALAVWFRDAADSGSLERYLETFAHTCAVMQTRDALFRVAAECAEDLAADGVVYAEVRYAPEQHQVRGLSLDEVVDAVNEGLREGERRAGGRITVRALLTGMRHTRRSLEIAELTVAHRDRGVAGFDIAGGEIGNPPANHLAAFQHLKRHNCHFTIHAGEAVGAESIHEAVQVCGAERIGHGVRITDDIQLHDDGTATLGHLAAYIRDNRIALEVCPTSNLQTGAAKDYATHPIDLLRRLGFRVTLNTDNRLVSGTTMSREFQHMADAFGYGPEVFERFTVAAVESAFLPLPERRRIIDEVIRPGYSALG